MKQNFYKITASNRFQAVIQFLRKELAWKPGDPLVRGILFRCNMTLNQALLDEMQFTYINLAFSPAPDDTVLNLYKVSASIASSRSIAESNLPSLSQRMAT